MYDGDKAVLTMVQYLKEDKEREREREIFAQVRTADGFGVDGGEVLCAEHSGEQEDID